MWAEYSHCLLASRNAAANGRDTKVFEPLCWGPLCYYGDALFSVHFALLGTHHLIQQSPASSGTNKKPWKCLKMLIWRNLVWHSFQQWGPCKNPLKVKENTRAQTGQLDQCPVSQLQQVPATEWKTSRCCFIGHTRRTKCDFTFYQNNKWTHTHTECIPVALWFCHVYLQDGKVLQYAVHHILLWQMLQLVDKVDHVFT